MKPRKCKICKKRPATTRHAKDYNHANIKAPGNCARLCGPCHTAFHTLNQKNNLDWDYMNRIKKKEIIKLAEELERKGKKLLT